jgi:hypothetical protein
MENTTIGILLGYFILTFIWKWRESKWILNFQYIKVRGQIFEMNRDRLHQLGFIYNLILCAGLAYLAEGLTLKAVLIGLTLGFMFWAMDIILNVFIKQPLLYTGKTAILDRIPILARLSILVTLILIQIIWL